MKLTKHKQTLYFVISTQKDLFAVNLSDLNSITVKETGPECKYGKIIDLSKKPEVFRTATIP
jgi:hypothetical protein